MHLYPSESWRKSVIVWEAFLAAGIDELLHCEKSFNALEFRILQNGLLPTKEKLLSKVFIYFSTSQCSCPNCKDKSKSIRLMI